MTGQNFGSLFRRAMMEIHSGEAPHKIPVKFLVKFNAEISHPSWHTRPEHTGEGTGSRAVFDDDISSFKDDFLNHCLTKFAGTRPDRSYGARPRQKA